MKKILILLAAMILLFSGCIDQNQENQKTVKIGDNVSVDYTGIANGSVIVTSIESVAKENNLSVPNRKYIPIRFIVGKGEVIKGLDEGIIGMRAGESKTLTIPPEKAFGLKDPKLIETIPIIENISRTTTFPRFIEVPVDQFDSIFGANHKIGDIVQIPDTINNLTVQNITASNVSLSYNLKVGDETSQSSWKETVIEIDENKITTKIEAKKNDTFQFEGNVWNSTVIDINSENIILRHNRIPDTKIATTIDNKVKVHFNDTYIIMDSNNELAGETLTYNVTIKSIE